MSHWARLEAFYRDVPDLLSLPARKLLNLVLHWMMEHMDGEVWEREYRPVFFPDHGTAAKGSSPKAVLADAKPGEQGALNIERKEPVKVTDLSQFLGRAGGTGKSDPNKAVIAAKAKKPAIKIGADPDGNLSVDVPEAP